MRIGVHLQHEHGMAGPVYYLHDTPSSFRLELAGALSVSSAAEVERVWRTASSTLGTRAFVVDLDNLTSVDDAGRRLLVRWRQLGATFIAKSAGAQSIAELIAEGPVVERKAAGY
jgi:anti-anti-sigma regulatory factor